MRLASPTCWLVRRSRAIGLLKADRLKAGGIKPVARLEGRQPRLAAEMGRDDLIDRRAGLDAGAAPSVRFGCTPFSHDAVPRA
jgi:hypothetical protein